MQNNIFAILKLLNQCLKITAIIESFNSLLNVFLAMHGRIFLMREQCRFCGLESPVFAEQSRPLSCAISETYSVLGLTNSFRAEIDNVGCCRRRRRGRPLNRAARDT